MALPTLTTLEPYYLRWLAGEPLRTLAQRWTKEQRTKASYSALAAWFAAYYGPGATCPTATSLQRSMLADYPDNPVVLRWVKDHLRVRSDTKHRSNHSIKQLTKFQVARTDTILEYMVPQGNNPWDLLEPETEKPGLPWLLLTLSVLLEVLRESLLHPLQSGAPSPSALSMGDRLPDVA